MTDAATIRFERNNAVRAWDVFVWRRFKEYKFRGMTEAPQAIATINRKFKEERCRVLTGSETEAIRRKLRFC